MAHSPDQSDQTRREKILSAALELFVERGYAGSSMSMIAKKAGVPQSLIYHYFDNKEILWREAKAAFLSQNKDISKRESWDDLPFPVFIEKLVVSRIRFYLDHPFVMRMINWQRLEDDPSLKGQTPMTTSWLIPYFQHYQGIGDMRRDLDAMQGAAWVIGSITAPLFDDYDRYQQDPGLQERYIQMVVTCLLRALCC